MAKSKLKVQCLGASLSSNQLLTFLSLALLTQRVSPFQDDFPTFQASGSLYTICHIELHLPMGFQLPLPAILVQASEPAQILRFFIPAVVVFWLLLIPGLLLQLPSALALLSTFSLTPCNKTLLLQTLNGGFCF